MFFKNIFECLAEKLILQPTYVNMLATGSNSTLKSGNIIFHQGRTDSNKGHNVYKNKVNQSVANNQNDVKTALYNNQDELTTAAYHYHHGMEPHLHPNGICPYGTKFSSLIDLFKTYGGIVFTTVHSSSGNVIYVFEAAVEYEKKQIFYCFDYRKR